MANVFEDVIDAVWEDVQDTAQGVVGGAAQQILSSSDFQMLLDEVEIRARAAVIEETRKNAFTLFMFALAGGAIGGAVFRGGLGLIAAGGLSFWAANRLGFFEGTDINKIQQQITDSFPGSQQSAIPWKKLPSRT